MTSPLRRKHADTLGKLLAFDLNKLEDPSDDDVDRCLGKIMDDLEAFLWQDIKHFARKYSNYKF